MNRLPFFTILFLCTLIFAWNFSFYEAQVAYAPDAAREAQRVGEASAAFASGGVDQPVAAAAERLLVPISAAMQGGAKDGDVAVADGDGPPAGTVGSPSAPGSPASRTARDGGVGVAPRIHEVRFYSSGEKRAEGYVQAGLRVATWTEWWESGEVKSEGSYVADRPEGEWSYRYESGAIQRRGSFERGDRVGRWRTWDEGGRLLMEESYRQGALEGEWTHWYSNGQIREQGRYVRGLREGEWRFFDREGRTMRRTGRYVNGRRVH